MSDWADGVPSAMTSNTGSSAVMSKLLSMASGGSPWAAAAGAALTPDTVTATSGANGNKFESSFGNSGWNVNFGEGSITSSATSGATRESISQWIGIAAGIVTIMVALKMLKG